MHKSVYLDNNATTPLDPLVYRAMEPYFEVQFGNPSSQLHQKGWEAKAAVESSRKKVASLLKCSADEIAFTAGATESNNWALKGLIESLKDQAPEKPLHVMTSNIEHASVKEPLLYLQKKGVVEVDFLPVNKLGFLDIETLEKYRKPSTRIVSLIWVHNEIGTIQNLKEIAEWAVKNNIYLHTDATQAVGKIEIDLQKIPVSLLSFSAHKLYGPKGVGALFIRQRPSKVVITPLLHGGGQESLGRSGTLNVPSIVGLGVACEIAEKQMQSDWEKALTGASKFWTQLKKEFPAVRLNGPEVGVRTAYNLNITLPGVSGEELLPQIQSGLCVSGGSACTSGNVQANPVLLALGHNPHDASVSLRLSSGRMNSDEDFDLAFATLSKALKSLHFGKREQGSLGLPTMLK